MNIKASTLFNEDVLSRARAWHWRKYGIIQWLWPPLGILFIIFGIIIVRESPSRSFGIVCLGIGVYCLLRKWMLGVQNRRSIRKSPYYRKVISWQIEEHQLSGETEGAAWNVAWDKFHETVTTPRACCFILTKTRTTCYQRPLLPLNRNMKRRNALSPRAQSIAT